MAQVGIEPRDLDARPFALLRIVSLELVGVLLLAALAILYVVLDNDSFFNFWTDRDMVRSEMLLTEFQWMGAELSYGSAARVPGGALHYLWAIPTLISKDPDLSYKFCVALGMLSLIPFYQAMRASFGAAGAITSTMVLMASPILFGTLTRLWNPSFQVPFIILAFAFLVRVVVEGRSSSFKWLVAALVLGMQMHLSTYLLVVCVILALMFTRTRIPLREVFWSVVLTLVLLAPYIVGEMATGWDNLRQMLGSQGKGAVRNFSWAKGLLYNPDNVGDVWRWYMLSTGMNDNLPPVPLQSAMSWVLNLAVVIGLGYLLISVIHWLEWGRPITRAAGLPCGGKYARALILAAIPVAVGFLYFSYSPQVELVIYGSARYLMFAIPGLAIIAGVGAAALLAIGQNSMIARAVLAVPVIIGVAMPAYALGTSLRALDKPWDQAGRDFMGGLNQVAREMSWTLADTVARTTVLRRHDASADRWKFESIFGIGYELHRTRTPVPFAAKGRCAAFLTNGSKIYGEKGISVEALERSLEQPGLDLSIIRQKKLSSDLLVVYERVDGQRYCFTSITNRYVLSDEEKAMERRYGAIPLATAEPTSATIPAGASGHILNLGNGIYAMLKLAQVPAGIASEFHSNQLRGDTYNGGFLDNGMIKGPRLVLTPREGQPLVVPIEVGLVGGKGTFTPIRETYQVPPGTYDVAFEAGVFPSVKLGQWPVDFEASKPVRIEVMRGLKVGEGR